MSMISTGPTALIRTVPLALGKHVFAAAEATILNLVESPLSSAAAMSGDIITNKPRTAAAARNCFRIKRNRMANPPLCRHANLNLVACTTKVGPFFGLRNVWEECEKHVAQFRATLRFE
jgi:hypothetical protein